MIFVVFLGDGFYPLNLLNPLKMVPEVCRIFCATANPTKVVLAQTEQERGLLGSKSAPSCEKIGNPARWRLHPLPDGVGPDDGEADDKRL